MDQTIIEALAKAREQTRAQSGEQTKEQKEQKEQTKAQRWSHAFVAPLGFEYELEAELHSLLKSQPNSQLNSQLNLKRDFKKSALLERLILISDSAESGAAMTLNAAWAQQVWTDLHQVEFQSVKEAADVLKKTGIKWWAGYSVHWHRRLELIQTHLPKAKLAKIDFLESLEKKPEMGAFTLLSPTTLLYARKTSSAMPLGAFEMNESKEPPSRAYLKLWEVLTRVPELRPKAGANCLDFGSCPGGWTWVLQSLGGRVYSVDKAPLDAKIAALKNVHYISKDAFKLKVEELPKLEHFFSDVICDPARLLELVTYWLEMGNLKTLVATLKFKGPAEASLIEAFKMIPGGRLIHLYHNKHELTFYWINNT